MENVCKYQRWHPSHVLASHLTGAQSRDRKKTGRAYTYYTDELHYSFPVKKNGLSFYFLAYFLQVLCFRASWHRLGRHLACHNT